jgi:hypothetical protein
MTVWAFAMDFEEGSSAVSDCGGGDGDDRYLGQSLIFGSNICMKERVKTYGTGKEIAVIVSGLVTVCGD